MKLLLARHGQTQYNLERRFYGASDSLLTDLGRHQAENLATSLKTKGEQPDLIISSALSRTLETAEIVIKSNGWQNIPLFKEADFNEISFGDWEGLTADEIEAQDSLTWQKYLAAPLETQFPQGESYQEFRERIMRAMRKIPWRERNLFIGHLGVLRTIVVAYNLSNQAYWDITFPQGDYAAYVIDELT